MEYIMIMENGEYKIELDKNKETIIDNLYYDFTINGAISREKMFGVGFNGK